MVKLSQTSYRWDNLLEILAAWRKNIEVKDNVSDEDRELIMNLSPADLKQREKWRQGRSLSSFLSQDLKLKTNN